VPERLPLQQDRLLHEAIWLRGERNRLREEPQAESAQPSGALALYVSAEVSSESGALPGTLRRCASSGGESEAERSARRSQRWKVSDLQVDDAECELCAHGACLTCGYCCQECICGDDLGELELGGDDLSDMEDERYFWERF